MAGFTTRVGASRSEAINDQAWRFDMTGMESSPTPAAAPGRRAVVIVPAGDLTPAAEQARREHTWAGRLGMPAHVTLAGPFDTGPEGIPHETLASLARALRDQPATATPLSGPSRWDDALIVYEPADAAGLTGLAQAAAGAIGGLPPRAFPLRPHVTVAMARLGADLDTVASDLQHLPAGTIDAREAWVMERDRQPGAPWELRARLPIGPGT
ncbi:2'-5' RNA ligase family protein [Aquisalimonas sp.]|uniref:2'-5' RNA ligase family protein n=1 Tax=Aquisalimonas sp. TaxID=1872621 RepID=UPI0025BC5D96|nr:2'-5' RNA ligase family protein [Aquisalimonas sp.]